MKYTTYELIELFSSKPTYADEESYIFKYSTTDSLGFAFHLFFIACEQVACVQLLYQDSPEPIYAFNFENVEEIRVQGSKLIFLRPLRTKIVEISFEAHFSIKLSSGLINGKADTRDDSF